MSIYHVSKLGNDKNAGTEQFPFLTISRAACVAEAGDTVVVHGGVYRECVNPERGGLCDFNRITYTSAAGEHAVIKGSEEVRGWVRDGEYWLIKVDNAVFGTFNPFAEEIDGDWLRRPLDHKKHTGMVYIDGEAVIEATTFDALAGEEMRWFAQVGDDVTAIYANFAGKDPNAALTEINVRRSCFYPEKQGLNYITVCGFEMAHAATKWAPPTADQTGLIGTHWSKGWIIENNIIHDARCAAVCVGKDGATGDNMYNKYHKKAGGVYQFEEMLAAKRMGWSKETIGSHIIRNNVIYDCGQNGIVGHMGGAFSEIYGNEIYNIGTRNEFWGHELGGIKLHALIDTQIHHNHIHHCAMGTWLDWQVQGVRVSCNVYHHNDIDIKIEVTHGPHLVDNNIFGSAQNFQNAAQGGAYVHNLFLGGMYKYDVLDRPTPYHLPHSTEISGCSLVYGGDDRFINNIFAYPQEAQKKDFEPGLSMYDGSPVSLQEYIDIVWKKYPKGDVYQFSLEKQPVYTAHNFYADGVPSFERDETSVKTETRTDARIVTEKDGVYLEMTVDTSFENIKTEVVTTQRLDMPRLTEAPYENPDGTPITVDRDLLGNVRGEHPTAGPIENLGTGSVRVLLFKKQ